MLPIKRMSKLTHRLLKNIDYAQIAATRRANFQSLHGALGSLNSLKLDSTAAQVPMVYPFYTKVPALRQRLIENRIYVAQYWPNVVEWTEEGDLEREYALRILPLPIDQRYSASDMERIVGIVRGGLQ